jgi:hypothetical protein
MTRDELRGLFTGRVGNAEGILGVPLDTPTVFAPIKIELSADQTELLYGDTIDADTGPGKVIEPAGALDQFVDLVGKPPRAILDFAQTYGPLHLCAEHQMPAQHFVDSPVHWIFQQPLTNPPAAWGWTCIARPAEAPRALVRRGLLYREPIEVWRKCAGVARAIVVSVALLRSGKIPDRATLKTLCKFIEKQGYEDDILIHHSPADLIRVVLPYAIDTWMTLSNVTLRFSPAGFDRLRMTLISKTGLFGVLGFQLALSINGADVLYVCAGCGLPFQGKKTAGQRHFCDECKKRRRNALNQAAFRKNNPDYYRKYRRPRE